MHLIDEAARVAFASLIHDVGKFAQRAGLTVSPLTKDTHVQLYCPRTLENRPTHIHAAYTPMAIDAMEAWLPNLVGGRTAPFEGAGALEHADSLINAAGAHHRPETLLQWIVATADRAASGFERETKTEEEARSSDGDDYIRTRLWSLLEEIRLDRPEGAAPLTRKPLRALSVDALFPRQGIVPEKRTEGEREYRALWDDFLKAGRRIPNAMRRNWPLWLDAFDTLWLAYTQSIPSATAFNARPDVSLYDHSKATAAVATALWAWCEASGRDTDTLVRGLKDRSLWNEESLLLVQGDFFGIQDFIFSGAASTQKKAAKILRGRSFYVSLLTEAAALAVLEKLALPATSQILNAAGKFLIVAPNTPEVRERLRETESIFETWFVKETCAQAGLGLAFQAATLRDLTGERFPKLMRSIFESLERSKLTRYRLFDEDPTNVPGPVLEADYRFGPCAWQGRWPADELDENGLPTARLTRDEIAVGEAIVRMDTLALVDEDVRLDGLGFETKTLDGAVFGSRAIFFAHGNVEAFLRAVPSESIRRVWDFSMPRASDEVLWRGLSRRSINGYVPRLDEALVPEDEPRFAGLPGEDIGHERILPFEWIARLGQSFDERGRICGVPALCALKGDVDQLGRIFQEGLVGAGGRGMNFAKMAGLSREFNAFFSIAVPFECSKAFPHVYTVFAGGDDFFFIGPLSETQRFATALRDRFVEFSAVNPEVHFSAGFAVVKPGMPVRRLSEAAEEALSRAKNSGRNAVCAYGECVSWTEWKALLEVQGRLESWRSAYGLSTSYLYALFEIMELAERSNDPRAAIWRSRLYYRTTRWMENVARERRLSSSAASEATTQLLGSLTRDLETHGARMRIPLTNLFYGVRRAR